MENSDNRQRFTQLAETIGITPSSVPTFIWCGEYHTGYQSDDTTGQKLVKRLGDCYEGHYGERPSGWVTEEEFGSEGKAEDKARIDLPWFDSLDASRYSLPTLAVILGGLDAFNPCAFFVLLFLLSLLVNTRSRRRMLFVGGLFVVTSGFVYFAFMAAWLNVFQLVDGISAITLVAGSIAIVIGILGIKEYFHFQQGVSLSLSPGRKAELFRRMRGLLNTEHLSTVLFGTMALALAANSYEILCTMGLPMVFTRILTLEQLSASQYYGYLVLYNLVYVSPLAIIVGLFVASMGRRKLSEGEGRFLKLLSGAMMGGLGLVLVASPEQLTNPLRATLLIVATVLVTFGVHYFYQRQRKR